MDISVRIGTNSYPTHWSEISERIQGRSANTCECCVECGIVHSRASADSVEPRTCGRMNGQRFLRTEGELGSVVLTTAHLDHNPSNCEPGNLRAMCQPCHSRYDSALHVRT
jgi:hypothetical protein